MTFFVYRNWFHDGGTDLYFQCPDYMTYEQFRGCVAMALADVLVAKVEEQVRVCVTQAVNAGLFDSINTLADCCYGAEKDIFVQAMASHGCAFIVPDGIVSVYGDACHIRRGVPEDEEDTNYVLDYLQDRKLSLQASWRK